MYVDASISQGQHEARTRWGTHESGAEFDRKKRPFLTEDAREFIAQQVMGVLVGPGVEQEPRGLLLTGEPGFVKTPDALTCVIPVRRCDEALACIEGLYAALDSGKAPCMALCFVQHITRQRICVQGEVEILSEHTPSEALWLRMRVNLAFFHCPKYLRTRIPGMHMAVDEPLSSLSAQAEDRLTADVCHFLAQQVLCYLCTVDRHGVFAVNHRGGARGFLVTLAPDRLTPGGVVLLPDYAGNGAFEAIGNILETGKAALLVPGYREQILLCVTGEAAVLEPGHLPEFLRAKCRGAQRVVALTVQHVERQIGDWGDALVYERGRAARMASEAQSCLI